MESQFALQYPAPQTASPAVLDKAAVWMRGPFAPAPLEALLGGLTRLDFPVTGWSSEVPSPAAAAPSTPVPPAPAIKELTVRAPFTQALPVDTPGIAPVTLAKPATFEQTAVVPAIAPQVPPPEALPLRRKMLASPAPAPALKPVRSVGKAKRADIRVVSATGVQTNPAPAPIAAAPVAPTPVASPTPPPLARAEKAFEAARAFTPQEPASDQSNEMAFGSIEKAPGPWERLPVSARVGAGVVAALTIITFAYSAMNSGKATAKPTAPVAQSSSPGYELGNQINTGGWNADWIPDDTQHRVTLLRGSQPYSNYRIEFEGQIQSKALGWMYRGINPRNFYVNKIERKKYGDTPVVVLVRYAMIDGKAEGPVEKQLQMPVRVDTVYKVRLDAVGADFSVWVQGQKVDSWRDARLGSGGLGLYAEGEETATIKGSFNVHELVPSR
jgi:hypothetical protein